MQQQKTAIRVKEIDRKQLYLTTVDIEGLIDEGHPARAIWEFVGQLDLSRYQEDIRAFEGQAGRSPFQPQLLISLWLYGYSQGVGKAREISRLCDHDPAFQWLTGMEKINYHTLSDFRIRHKEKLDHLFKQVLAVLQAEGIVDLTLIFHDGSKIAANAARSSFHRSETIQSKLELAEAVIHQLETEDSQQQNKRVAAAKERAAAQRKESLTRALQEFTRLPATTTRKQVTRVSTTDADARTMLTTAGGYAPAYNAQISTEGKHGFIVAADIAQSSADFGQLPAVPDNVNSNTGHTPRQIVVDSGFASKQNIIQLHRRGIEVVGPLLPQSSTVQQLEKRGVDPAFGKEAFSFDSDANCYLCPAGKTLRYSSTRKGKASLEHIYKAAINDCKDCPFNIKCCGKARQIRRCLVRTEDLPEITAFKEKMETETAKQLYKRRSQFAEFPFAWIKEKFGLRRFNLRGKHKAAMELIWVCMAFNIIRFLQIKPILSP